MTNQTDLRPPPGEPLFKKDDAVTLHGKVYEVYPHSEGLHTYYVMINTGADEDGDASEDGLTVGEDALLWNQDQPMAQGDYVTPRLTRNAIGQITGIAKGVAWVDWQPFNPSAVGFSSTNLSVLDHASLEEIEAAQKQAA